jgi:hypothetical protein
MNLKETGFESVDIIPVGNQTPVVEFVTNHFTNRATPFNNNSIHFNSILYYLCAESTAVRP